VGLGTGRIVDEMQVGGGVTGEVGGVDAGFQALLQALPEGVDPQTGLALLLLLPGFRLGGGLGPGPDGLLAARGGLPLPAPRRARRPPAPRAPRRPSPRSAGASGS